MSVPDLRLLYITAPSSEVADELAAHLVEQRLAACANIIPGMRSVYRWQGEVCRDDEVVIIAKTTAATAPAARTAIAAMHPAECPCVIELPVDGGHAPFLLWIAEQTS